MQRQVEVPSAVIRKDGAREELIEGRDWSIQHFRDGARIRFASALTLHDGDSLINHTKVCDLPDDLLEADTINA